MSIIIMVLLRVVIMFVSACVICNGIIVVVIIIGGGIAARERAESAEQKTKNALEVASRREAKPFPAWLAVVIVSY